MKISNWIKTLQGKSRWELQYDSTGLMLDDCRVLVADVYDDYLIFNLLDVELNARQLFMMESSKARPNLSRRCKAVKFLAKGCNSRTVIQKYYNA